jgi:hypothetical protein
MMSKEKMSNKIFYAEVHSPNPSANWLALSEPLRIEKINQAVNQKNPSFNKELLVVSAKNNGDVVVRILNPLTAFVRGTLLLDFEEFLKQEMDQGLTVWGEALGDKNSLRNLRGIEVKIS